MLLALNIWFQFQPLASFLGEDVMWYLRNEHPRHHVYEILMPLAPYSDQINFFELCKFWEIGGEDPLL